MSLNTQGHQGVTCLRRLARWSPPARRARCSLPPQISSKRLSTSQTAAGNRRIAVSPSALCSTHGNAARAFLPRGCGNRLVTSRASARPAEPTIYALSSAPGRAAIAVIRISGSACLPIYQAICVGQKDPRPRVASVRTLYEPGEEARPETVLDSRALVLYFRAPATATGEDVLEFHVHGGPAIVKAVLGAISRCGAGTPYQIRYAEPGEFTRRAFMNNRMDLTQVEAVGDALSAETEQQRRLSILGTTGGLAQHYEKWRQQLLYARGELEALIDFSEDQHFDESPTELFGSVGKQVLALKRALNVHVQNAMRGELLRHGISVSLLGAPNVGKSSLLNRIVGREAAIVSNEAGTTRDVVEIGVDLGGYFCRFGDTAGLRRQAKCDAVVVDGGHRLSETINRVEMEGMRRAKARAADSDVLVVVFQFELINNRAVVNFDPDVCAFAHDLLAQTAKKDRRVILVINKADLAMDVDADEEDQEAARAHAIGAALERFPALGRQHVHMVSCISDNERSGLSDLKYRRRSDLDDHDDHDGIQSFLNGLVGQFERLTAGLTLLPDAAGPSDSSVWQQSLGASERHRVLLEACVSHLDAFLAEAVPSMTQPLHDVVTRLHEQLTSSHQEKEADLVVAAEHLRAAADCLARITGQGEAGDVEEVLGVVFEKFCVGK